MITAVAILTPLLAQSTEDWVRSIVSGLGGSGFGLALAWYFLTKWSPQIEMAHQKQLLEQRNDLLALCQKERELAEKVVKIFADSQAVTVKDNNDSLNHLHDKADLLRQELMQAAREVVEMLRADTTLKDEMALSRKRLDDLEKKYGSKFPRQRGGQEN